MASNTFRVHLDANMWTKIMKVLAKFRAKIEPPPGNGQVLRAVFTRGSKIVCSVYANGTIYLQGADEGNVEIASMSFLPIL